MKVFYEITLQISCTQYYIVNIYFEEVADLSTHLHKILNEATEILYGMAVKMKVKFNRYWEKVEKINKLLIVAIVFRGILHHLSQKLRVCTTITAMARVQQLVARHNRRCRDLLCLEVRPIYHDVVVSWKESIKIHILVWIWGQALFHIGCRGTQLCISYIDLVKN